MVVMQWHAVLMMRVGRTLVRLSGDDHNVGIESEDDGGCRVIRPAYM